MRAARVVMNKQMNAMRTPTTAADSSRPMEAKSNISSDMVRVPGAAISKMVLMSRIVPAKVSRKT